MDDDQLEFGFVADLEKSSVHYIPIGMYLRGFTHAYYDGKKIRYVRTAGHPTDKRCPHCARGRKLS